MLGFWSRARGESIVEGVPLPKSRKGALVLVQKEESLVDREKWIKTELQGFPPISKSRIPGASKSLDAREEKHK